MAESESQRRANLRYRKRTHRLMLQFRPDDPMWEWLEEHRPKATYVKGLIRDDMAGDTPDDGTGRGE